VKKNLIWVDVNFLKGLEDIFSGDEFRTFAAVRSPLVRDYFEIRTHSQWTVSSAAVTRDVFIFLINSETEAYSYLAIRKRRSGGA
jgi:hypothetical protein